MITTSVAESSLNARRKNPFVSGPPTAACPFTFKITSPTFSGPPSPLIFETKKYTGYQLRYGTVGVANFDRCGPLTVLDRGRDGDHSAPHLLQRQIAQLDRALCLESEVSVWWL